MKTKQEQIEKLAQLIGRIKDDCENCDCKSCEVNGEDCCCVHYICSTFLVDAGYGDVSEYKAEIERLKAEYENLQTNAEILASGVRDLNHENYELTKKVKQAKIDALNELKERARTSYVLDDFILGSVVFSKDIDELIKEVQNGKDKG